jgi:hypothetical protein
VPLPLGGQGLHGGQPGDLLLQTQRRTEHPADVGMQPECRLRFRFPLGSPRRVHGCTVRRDLLGTDGGAEHHSILFAWRLASGVRCQKRCG